MTNDSTQIQNAADELGTYAGRITWKFDGEPVETLDDISVGDRVAAGRGEGRQGIVQQIRHKRVIVATGNCGESHHILHDKEHYTDDAAGFGFPNTANRVHKLVVIESGVVEVDEDDYDPRSHVDEAEAV